MAKMNFSRRPLDCNDPLGVVIHTDNDGFISANLIENEDRNQTVIARLFIEIMSVAFADEFMVMARAACDSVGIDFEQIVQDVQDDEESDNSDAVKAARRSQRIEQRKSTRKLED